MHFQNNAPCQCKHQNLGFIESLVPLATTLFAGGGSDGVSPAGAPAGANVSTNVNPNIQVSPQISPVFQQQFQPSNSPISAGTSQSAPFTAHPDPSYSAGGGLPNFTPAAASNIPMPSPISAPVDWNKILIWGGVGVVGLFAIKLLSGRKKPAARRYRRVNRRVIGRR